MKSIIALVKTIFKKKEVIVEKKEVVRESERKGPLYAYRTNN
jgi:hypothetical protein